MVPTSQGFTEVRDVFFKEVTDMNLNVINEGGIDKLGEVSRAPGAGAGQAPSGAHCDGTGPSPPGHNLWTEGLWETKGRARACFVHRPWSQPPSLLWFLG